MKYRDNMTPQEMSAFMRLIDITDRAYASADMDGPPVPEGEEHEDEMELLRRAALSRGQP